MISYIGFVFQGKNLVTQSMQLVSLVGETVLISRLPGEGTINIQIEDMVITLERHLPTQLVGLNIQGGSGRFFLPNEKGVIEPLTSHTSFVDSQVRKQTMRS